MVGAELHLKPIYRCLLWCLHDARIIDEDIERVCERFDLINGFPDGRHIRKIELNEYRFPATQSIDSFYGSLSFDLTSRTKENIRPFSSQYFRSFQADAGIPARDQNEFARLITHTFRRPAPFDTVMNWLGYRHGEDLARPKRRYKS